MLNDRDFTPLISQFRDGDKYDKKVTHCGCGITIPLFFRSSSSTMSMSVSVERKDRRGIFKKRI